MSNKMITFKYCGRIFTGSLSPRLNSSDGLPLIFYKDFEGFGSWVAQKNVKIIKEKLA